MGSLERAYLREQWQAAQKMAEVLEYSYRRAEAVAAGLADGQAQAPAQAEMLEALSARFARLADSLTQKVFRAIDAVELSDEGSLLDRLGRMEKRGLIESAAAWAELRKLRNQIAHDYVLSDLNGLYRAVYQQCGLLFSAMAAINQYMTDLES